MIELAPEPVTMGIAVFVALAALIWWWKWDPD